MAVVYDDTLARRRSDTQTRREFLESPEARQIFVERVGREPNNLYEVAIEAGSYFTFGACPGFAGEGDNASGTTGYFTCDIDRLGEIGFIYTISPAE